MKKLFTLFKTSTLLLCVLFSTAVFAQDKLACEVTFNNFSRTFTYLTTGTNVSDIESACGTKSGIPIGFDFHFGASATRTTYKTLQVSSAGWVKFGSAVTGCKNDVSAKAIFPGLWPFYGKGFNGTSGTATYYTELLPSGLKVFTMEWRDWSWDEVGGGASAGTFSCQLKLYEASDVIEFCYKRESGALTSTSLDPYMCGLGNSAPTAVVTWPCGPGYDMLTVGGGTIPSAPVINKSGSYGAAQTDLPNTDDVYQFYQKCMGKPSAGYVSQPDSVCAGAPFVLRTFGTTPNPFAPYGISYQWQAAPAATGPWGDISGATSLTFSFPGIYNDSFFRLIVYCSNSNKYDTTVAKHITLITQPYNCYCYSKANNDVLNANIGNFKLIAKGNDTLLNVGTSGPSFINKGIYNPYTLNTGLRPIQEINRDTTYTFSVVGITRDSFSFPASGVALYIDYNADGLYDAASEIAGFQVISGTKAEFITNFTVPSSAKLDTVGMRLIMKNGATSAADVPPCGAYADGETEDYLINITYPKCPGPLLPGTSYISDTSMCYGYPVTIWNNTHAQNMSKMHWQWEYSLDNINWADVIGGKFQDTLMPIVRQTTYYRLRMVCEYTNDTIYSNKVLIKLKQPYKCYCFSLANGGAAGDSSDISTFVLGKFIMNTGGPHLNNPMSIRQRTDHTDLPAIELYSMDKYNIAVYQTMKNSNHADAKISVFMDFNHNLSYEVSELIWSKTTSATDFYPHDTITIPVTVIPNVETGLRVVLNNDLGANNANDQGCDAFQSGEIEDYLVIFRRRGTGIGEISNVDNLQIYPNPNNGQFTVSFKAKHAIENLQINVSTVTGQQVYTEKYSQVQNSFNKNINLSNYPSGIYFISVEADGQKQVNKLVIQ